MKVKSKPDDRRTNRTRQALRKALTQLILEKHYDTISVQDIIDRANVGRSTFYTHFRDKEDLFRGDWERLLHHFVEQITPESLNENRVFPIRELFDHLKDFHHFYRALVKSGKIDKLFSLGQSYLAQKFQEKITSLLLVEPLIPSPILANFLASEVFSNLKWWLDNNMPQPPEKMDEMFHGLVMPGLRLALTGEKRISVNG